MIRNNLEILSLSKISNLTQDNRYSVRDLSPHNDDYTIKRNLNKIKAGFLISIRGNYHIIECSEFERLSYEDLQVLIDEEGIGNKIKESNSVKEKYRLIDNRPFYENEENSNWAIVLTGKMFNKKAEYGFKFPKKIKPLKLSKSLNDDFRFIYEKETESATWKFWKNKIRNFNSVPDINELTKEICWAPVFFMKEKEKVVHIGLTYLYREPYKNSVHQLLPQNHFKSDKYDFTEALFGTISNKSGLKGRVIFSHSFFSKYEEESEREIILGSPKPTFFPFYIKQDKKEKYNTFANDQARINGWKKYLIHKTINYSIFTNENINVRTQIKPIKPGSIFSTTICFHNLKAIELGGLLSALTFHNNHDKCYHLIGMGKPLGYGKIKVTDLQFGINDFKGAKFYMAQFEDYICEKMFNNEFQLWENAISKLFVFSSENNSQKEIRYPKAFKEFKDIKKHKLNIGDFAPEESAFKLKSLSKSH